METVQSIDLITINPAVHKGRLALSMKEARVGSRPQPLFLRE
jgi:hypothetical protein